MRSTIDLSEVLDRKVRALATAWKVSLREAFERIVSAGLAVHMTPKRNQKEFKIKAKACGFLPGVEIDHLNRVIDEIDDRNKFS